ncbi:MAG: formylglycine-generating enzyme family protein [Nitrospirae bacterium]|nr:formylglycine-generating enzyme family protein [Nitrospirota bacterium]
MVFVKGGSYVMGDGSIKSVGDFYIGKYEVTQGQWRKITGNNPSNFSRCGDNCPVERISWNDVQGFIRELNRLTDGKYRLPTEAEWEYACRSGGNVEEYSGSNNIDDVAWYVDNSRKKTHQAGTKSPNGLGIYDMSGNVWEWTEDRWDSSSDRRVFKGGGWYGDAELSRCAWRDGVTADDRDFGLGFRVVRGE